MQIRQQMETQLGMGVRRKASCNIASWRGFLKWCIILVFQLINVCCSILKLEDKYEAFFLSV